MSRHSLLSVPSLHCFLTTHFSASHNKFIDNNTWFHNLAMTIAAAIAYYIILKCFSFISYCSFIFCQGVSPLEKPGTISHSSYLSISLLSDWLVDMMDPFPDKMRRAIRGHLSTATPNLGFHHTSSERDKGESLAHKIDDYTLTKCLVHFWYRNVVKKF